MKFLRSLAVALGLGFGAFGLAVGATALLPFEGPGQSLTGYTAMPCCENTIPAFNAVINSINSLLNLNNANTAVALKGPTGKLFSQTGPISSLATTQALTISTYTTPANTFDTGGRTLRIHAEFHTVANFDSKSFACGWGGAQVTKTVTTDSGSAGTCDFYVTQGPTADTQMMSGRIIFGTTPTIAVLAGTTTGSGTQASAQNAYFEVATPTTAGDVIIDNFEIFYDN